MAAGPGPAALALDRGSASAVDHPRPWDREELCRFVTELRRASGPREGLYWRTISDAMGTGRGEEEVKALYASHASYLALDGSSGNELHAILHDRRVQEKGTPTKRARAGEEVCGAASADEERRKRPARLTEDLPKQRRLANWSASPAARRWAAAEWFYSPMDMALYDAHEYESTLVTALGVQPGARLTRMEWSRLRSVLCDAVAGGSRPRRLSKLFLREERARLAEHCLQIRQGIKSLASSDPRSWLGSICLRPKQKVLAMHPEIRLLCLGEVVRRVELQRDFYRISFDNGLGVHLVEDSLVGSVNAMQPFGHTALPPTLSDSDSALRYLRDLPITDEDRSPKPQIDLPLLARALRLLDAKDELVSAMAKINDELSTVGPEKRQALEVLASRRFSRLSIAMTELNQKLAKAMLLLQIQDGNAATGRDVVSSLDQYVTVLVRKATSIVGTTRTAEEHLGCVARCVGMIVRLACASQPGQRLPRLSDAYQLFSRAGQTETPAHRSLLREVERIDETLSRLYS